MSSSVLKMVTRNSANIHSDKSAPASGRTMHRDRPAFDSGGNAVRCVASRCFLNHFRSRAATKSAMPLASRNVPAIWKLRLRQAYQLRQCIAVSKTPSRALTRGS